MFRPSSLGSSLTKGSSTVLKRAAQLLPGMLPDSFAALGTESNNHLLTQAAHMQVWDYDSQWSSTPVALSLPNCHRFQLVAQTCV